MKSIIHMYFPLSTVRGSSIIKDLKKATLAMVNHNTQLAGINKIFAFVRKREMYFMDKL